MSLEGKLTSEMEKWINSTDELIMELFASKEAISASSQILTGTSWWEGRPDSIHHRAGTDAVHLAACFGLRQHIAMLKSASYAVDAKENRGWTPLSWAAYCGCEAVVEQLLGDLKSPDKDLPLKLAVIGSNEGIIRLLLDRGANIEARAGLTIELLTAINSFVRKRLRFKTSWLGGLTPLAWAARLRCTAMVKLLLQKGANANNKDSNGMSSLLWAFGDYDAETRLLFRRRENELEELVEALIDGGADIEVKSPDGSTSLANAARRCHEGVVRMLLKKGATVDAQDSRGWTPLMVAARSDHEVIVRLLLEALVRLHSLHPPGCITFVRKGTRFRMNEIMGKDVDGRTPAFARCGEWKPRRRQAAP